MVDGYVRPSKGDAVYDEYNMKSNFLKNHLLTAIIHSTVISFVNTKTMDSVQMLS